MRRSGEGACGDRLLASLRPLAGKQVTSRQLIAPRHYLIRMEELHRRDEELGEKERSAKHRNEISSSSFRLLTGTKRLLVSLFMDVEYI